MNKFLLIDKPIGITSFDVLRKLRKIYNTKKLGHTGTLDPLATGLLLVAFGDYTKLIPYFEKAKKTYLFEISLDGTTPSFDKETEISYISEEQKEHYKNTITIDKISSILKAEFSGPIKQIPPKYSAIKIGGKKALDMVRNGEEFEVKKRDVIIHHIDIIEFNYPYLTLEAEVSAGTYIRSIANYLGEILGCGGYITKLRRTKIENLDLSLSCELEDLKSDDFLDEKYLFDSSKYIKLDEVTLGKINNGLKVRGDFPFQKDIDLFVKNDELITNIVKYDGDCLSAVRKIV